MAKLSNAKIKYIINNINDFEPMVSITTAINNAPEVKTPSREIVCKFISEGFSVNQFAVNNDLLTVEIDGYRGLAVSDCVEELIEQSIYGIETDLGIEVAFTITDGCYLVANTPVISLDCVYSADELAQCYSIVQAEQLAENIAFSIHFGGCEKRVYDIDPAQYDTETLRKTLAQFGISSDFTSNARK